MSKYTDLKTKYDELKERVETLEEMFQYPETYSSPLYRSLYERNTALWAKFSRLFHYLGAEDVVEPEQKLIRKLKVTTATSTNSKPKKGAA